MIWECCMCCGLHDVNVNVSWATIAKKRRIKISSIMIIVICMSIMILHVTVSSNSIMTTFNSLIPTLTRTANTDILWWSFFSIELTVLKPRIFIKIVSLYTNVSISRFNVKLLNYPKLEQLSSKPEHRSCISVMQMRLHHENAQTHIENYDLIVTECTG
jgi:hypothetical protein